MSTTAAKTDSGLSGQPSDDIDKQRGPSEGSDTESPGGTFGTVTTAVGKDQHKASNDQKPADGNPPK